MRKQATGERKRWWLVSKRELMGREKRLEMLCKNCPWFLVTFHQLNSLLMSCEFIAEPSNCRWGRWQRALFYVITKPSENDWGLGSSTTSGRSLGPHVGFFLYVLVFYMCLGSDQVSDPPHETPEAGAVTWAVAPPTSYLPHGVIWTQRVFRVRWREAEHVGNHPWGGLVHWILLIFVCFEEICLSLCLQVGGAWGTASAASAQAWP